MIENDKRQLENLNEKSTNAEYVETKELADRLETVVSNSEKVLGVQCNKLDDKLQIDIEKFAENKTEQKKPQRDQCLVQG